MTTARASSPATPRPRGRGLALPYLWILGCCVVGVAVEAIFGPPSRRFMVGPLTGALSIGPIVILILSWSSAGSRAKNGPDGPPT